MTTPLLAAMIRASDAESGSAAFEELKTAASQSYDYPVELPEPVKTTVISPLPVPAPIAPFVPTHFQISDAGDGSPPVPELKYGTPDITPEENEIIQPVSPIGANPEPILGAGVTKEEFEEYKQTIGAKLDNFGIAPEFKLEFPDIMGGVQKWALIAGGVLVGAYLLGKLIQRK